MTADVYFTPKAALDVEFWPSLIPVQSVAPAASSRVWLDTSTTPPTLKGWNGSGWVAIDGGTSLTTEDVDDRVAALITAGANITKTYDDVAGTLTLAAASSALSGSGSPLGVVTPASVGLVYADTAATTGARLWVSTGTTSAAWKVMAGDTGQRLLSGYTGISTGDLRVRRIGDLVVLTVNAVGLSSSATTDAYNLPAGFQPSVWQNFPIMNDPDVPGGTSTLVFAKVAIAPPGAGGGASAGTVRFIKHTTVDWYSVLAFWPTTDAWPTTLPGTAA